MSHIYDVAIIGYGPTGATLAALLAKRGLSVIVFDKRDQIYSKPRAIGMDHEAMRILQRLGLAEAVMKTSVEYNPTVYLGVDGEPIQRIDITPRPFPLSWPPTSTFDQPKLEAELRHYIAGRPCATVMLGREVMLCRDQGDTVSLDTRSVGGQNTFTARYAVCCDGANSAIRAELQIDVEDLGFDEEWLVVDVIASDRLIARLPTTNVQYCDPRRPATYVICPGHHRRWEIKALPGETFGENIPDDRLYSLLARWLDPSEATLWRAAGYRFHARVAKKWRQGHILLAGDAAHQMPPFLGQGMCQGMRDAANLDWKLVRVLDGQSPDTLLDTYQTERRSHVVKVTEAVIGLGRIIGELDPERARERDIKMLREQGGEVRPKIRQAFIPGINDGLVHMQSAGAGTAFPQPVVHAQGKEARLDEFSCGRPYLVFAASLDPQHVPHVARLAVDHGITVFSLDQDTSAAGLIPIVETEPLLRDWFERLQCAAVIVRPDHYVFATCKAGGDTLELLEIFLQELSR